jgi:hypothetical protein
MLLHSYKGLVNMSRFCLNFLYNFVVCITNSIEIGTVKDRKHFEMGSNLQTLNFCRVNP